MPPTARLLAAAIIATTACSPARESTGFVYRLGNDTTAVAAVGRAGNTLDGVYVDRVPATLVTRWNATLGPNDMVKRLERTQTRGDSVIEKVVVTQVGDSMITERTRGDSVMVWRVAAPGGAMPRHVTSNPAFLEIYTRRGASANLERQAIAAVGTGDTAMTVDTLVRVAADSFTWGATSLKVDSAGRILRMGANAERADGLDIEALAVSFGSRPLGALSPRDSVIASVGGATVRVEYGRPFRRGRPIFGSLVPMDQVWRTGAGDATFLTADRDLDIGGQTVPAGRYSVFTLPSASGWKLILSRKTGDDAATYSADQDLARIVMTADSLPEPVDQFTIAIESAGRGGTLRMSWDRIRVSVPIRRR